MTGNPKCGNYTIKSTGRQPECSCGGYLLGREWGDSAGLSGTERVEASVQSITGAIAGTNSVHNFEVDASEIFLQNGKLAAYLYAQSFNRDLWKNMILTRMTISFFELSLSSPTPQFLGFELDEASGEVSYLFGKVDANGGNERDPEWYSGFCA